jgi:hypothetical protein
LLVQVPLPMAEVWEELQGEVEQLTGPAGCASWRDSGASSWSGPIVPSIVGIRRITSVLSKFLNETN